MRQRRGGISPATSTFTLKQAISRSRMLITRTLMIGLLWWVLTEGDLAISILGLVGVGVAVVVSFWLLPNKTWAIRPFAVIRFLPFFIWQSLLGGLDVALRAMRPGVNINPIVIRHSLSLKSEAAQVLFIWVISLLPGTAGVDLHESQARIHVLDETFADSATFRQLEHKIACLFKD